MKGIIIMTWMSKKSKLATNDVSKKWALKSLYTYKLTTGYFISAIKTIQARVFLSNFPWMIFIAHFTKGP